MPSQDPTSLVSTPAAFDPPKFAQVYGSRGSPDFRQNLRFDIRVTFWSGRQQEYPDMKTATIPPAEYADVHFIGAGPGQGVGIGYVGDDMVFYVPIWPKLTECEG